MFGNLTVNFELPCNFIYILSFKFKVECTMIWRLVLGGGVHT